MGSQFSSSIAEADQKATLCGSHLKSPEDI